jgi:hypothetical protein
MQNNYYSIQEWQGLSGKGEIVASGKIRTQVKLLKIENNNVIEIEITKDMTPFGQVIIARTLAIKNIEDKYEFAFNDGWENKAFGYIIFNNDNTLEFYLDCIEFSDYGKSIGRLYGSTYILKEGTINFE